MVPPGKLGASWGLLFLNFVWIEHRHGEGAGDVPAGEIVHHPDDAAKRATYLGTVEHEGKVLSEASRLSIISAAIDELGLLLLGSIVHALQELLEQGAGVVRVQHLSGAFRF